jgi:hypothetical protein
MSAGTKMNSSPTQGRETRFGAYDKLVRLEQEKRELQKALDINKKRLITGMQILHEKNETKVKNGTMKLNASQTTSVSDGYNVEDFRQPAARRRVQKVVKVRDLEDLEAETIKNPNIIRIREANLQHTLGQKRVEDLLQRKKLTEEKEAERKFKKLPTLERRKMPQISVPPSMLPDRYVRGELPCTIEHGIAGHYLSWAAPLDNLDYEYYLPIFFDGLQCKQNPARFLARQGIEDLLFAARGYPNRIKACVYSVVRPLRNALSKFDPDILLGVLKAVQQLVTCNQGIGAVLMPYSKQFLAPIATFMDLNTNIGDGIDYSQRHNNDIGENVRKTLELLEEFGGPDAYKAIKFSIPLYESCMKAKVIDRSGGAGAAEVKAGGGKAGGHSQTKVTSSSAGTSSKPGSGAISKAGSKPSSGSGGGARKGEGAALGVGVGM